MSNEKQKSIEYFFEQYNITDPDLKAKLLPEVTDIIYEYNMAIVKSEKEEDEYRQKQAMTEINELDAKIAEIFEGFYKKQ